MVRPAIPAPITTTSAVVFSRSGPNAGGAGAVASQLGKVAPEVRAGSGEAGIARGSEKKKQRIAGPTHWLIRRLGGAFFYLSGKSGLLPPRLALVSRASAGTNAGPFKH